MLISKFFLFFNTIRHLRTRQLLYQGYYRLRPLQLDLVSEAVPRSAVVWRAPAFNNQSTFNAVDFLFLGIKGRVDAEGWNSSHQSKLWLYNLHYLDDLNAIGIDEQDALARSLVNRWIEANPPPFGNGWEPYPLSLRIVNLVKWFARQQVLEPHWLASLAMQTQALEKQIEYHILGNHLFANGKALVFGGSYLAGTEADRCLSKGLQILDREIREQFLEDGAHFELSPMYHSSLLWDMCDLVNLAESSDLPELKARLPGWRSVIVRGLGWLRGMLHPDGEISFFNDAAFGIAPTLSELEIYASTLGGSLVATGVSPDRPLALTHYKQSGYATVDLGGGHKALLDLARVGPDYQPGHAHADTLSFELSLFGQRIFVNSGTSQYGEDAERHRQRSTSAHNTVEVDGENSSEVWAGFRVARRAIPVIEALAEEAQQVTVRAHHTGYRRLKGRNLHRRHWIFSAGSCQITDEITGPCDKAVARLHAHPDVAFSWVGDTLVAVLEHGQQVHLKIEGASSITLEPSTWHPSFGTVRPNQCIVAEIPAGKLVTHISWSGSV